MIFVALAKGGTVTMPLGGTFWAKKFGMVKGQFGCHWIVNDKRLEIRLTA